MKKNKKVASMLYSVAVLGTLLSPSVLNSASVVLAESIEEVGEVTTTIPEVATEDKVDNNIVKDLVEDTKQPTPESVKGTETSTETGTVEKSTDIVDEEENNQGQHKYVINYVSVDEYGNNPQLINTIKIDSNSLPELKMVYVGPDGNIYYWSSTSTKKINDNLSEGTIKYYRKRPDHFIYYKLSPEDEALAYPEGKPASPYNLEGSDEFDKPDGLEVPSESRENVPRPEPGGPGGNINPIDESIYITAFLDEDYSVEEPLRESHHGPQFIDPVDIPNYKFVRSENTESVLPGSYRLVHYYHHIKTQHIKVVDGTETVLETEEGAKEKKEFENLVYYETKTLENGDIHHYYKPTPPEKLYHTFFVDTETNANIADFELGDILPKIFPDYNFIRTEKFLRDDEVSDILHYYYHIKTKHVLQRDGEEDKVLKTEFGKKGRDAFDDVIFVRSEVKENGDTVHYYTPVTKNKTIHFDKENNKVLKEIGKKEDKKEFENYVFVNTEDLGTQNYLTTTRHNYHLLKTTHVLQKEGEQDKVLKEEVGKKDKSAFDDVIFVRSEVKENGDTVHYYTPVTKNKTIHFDKENNKVLEEVDTKEGKKEFENYVFVNTDEDVTKNYLTTTRHNYHLLKTTHVLQKEGEQDKVLKEEVGKKDKSAFDDVIFVRSEVKENGDTVHYYTPVTKNKTIHFDKENNKVLEEVDTKEGKKEFENYVFVNTEDLGTKNYLTTTRHNYHLLKTTHVLQKEGEQDKVLKEEVGKKDKSVFDDVIFVRSEVKENGDTVHYYTPVTKNKTIHFDKENNKVLEEVDTKEGKKEFENYVFVNTEDLGTKNYLTTTRHNYHLLKTTHVLQKEGEKDKVLKEEVGKKDKSTFDDVIFVHSEVKENGDTVHYYVPVTKNKTIHFDKENNKVLEEVDTKEGKKEFDNYVFVNTDEDVTKNYLTTTRHNYHLLKTTHILQKEGEKDKVLKGEIGKKDKSTFDDVVYVRSEVKENGDTVHYYTPVTKNKTIHFDKENNKVLEEVDTKEGKKEFENYVFVNTEDLGTKNYLTTTRHNYHLLKTTHVLQKDGEEDKVLKEEVGKKDKQDFSALIFVKSETLENGDTIHYYKEVETYLPPAPIVPEVKVPETVPEEKKKDKDPQPGPTPEVTKETPKENTPEPTKPTTKKVVPLETGVNAEGDLLPVWVITILSGVLWLAWFSKKDNKKEK